MPASDPGPLDGGCSKRSKNEKRYSTFSSPTCHEGEEVRLPLLRAPRPGAGVGGGEAAGRRRAARARALGALQLEGRAGADRRALAALRLRRV
eukprot:5273953-Prymnesium_polylepis.1